MTLRVSFDIGGVLSKYPEFKEMALALQRGGAEVFVVTDMHPRETSLKMLRENGFDFIPEDHILNADYTAHGEDCKAALIKEHGIQIHIDDFAGYCAHTEGISLFVWPNPEKPYYHDDWKADAGGDFGRRKKSRRP